MGAGLRFVQEYFLVACSLADLVRRFRRNNADWNALPDKAAIQLNDTHPSLAVPELMRILLDEAQLGWDQAWDLTRRTLAYTNHTLLPEALEKWPLRWFEVLLPRIWRSSSRSTAVSRGSADPLPGRGGPCRAREPRRGGQRAQDPDGQSRHRRLAQHQRRRRHPSDLLRTVTVKDLAEMFPERFSNKTNGVTPRRWLLLANPALARCITEAIGDGWISDLAELQKLEPLAEDKAFAPPSARPSTRRRCGLRIGSGRPRA